MEISKLNTFLTVVRSGSFHSAADELYLSSSTVSKHIAAIESELSVVLLKRTLKGVELTGDGKRLFPYIQKIIRNYTID